MSNAFNEIILVAASEILSKRFSSYIHVRCLRRMFLLCAFVIEKHHNRFFNCGAQKMSELIDNDNKD